MASLLRRRQAPQGRHTPNLWSVWVVAPLALLVVGALSFGLYHGVYGLLADAARSQKPRKPVNINDVIKTTVTVLTLVGAVLAGIYAYRKQLLSEGDAHRADASQLADRYTTAAEQLGHDQAAVRLAGVYALARLADDWEEQRQVCIDVLCAYLRMPYEADESAPGHKAGEREVRLTVIRVIRDHMRQPEAPTTWSECSFDFTGATFDGGDFSEGHFRGLVSFNGATFAGGTVSFDDATFAGGLVSFNGAAFAGGSVSFDDATFADGLVSFNHATFAGGTVTFNDATFGDCTVTFHYARFRGGTVPFFGAIFGDGTVSFNHAIFGDGTVTFFDAIFGGATVTFIGATFGGATVDFTGVGFRDGTVTFNRAAFRGGTVTFDGALFGGGTVIFDDATFGGGTVSFNHATFGDGTVTFTGATFGGAVITWGSLPPPAGA
ncbi:pentapeptide repeat-containing protein [Streptomyces sp. NBC_00322]|uniref:pentapeptide repeat-containing protein n=1 Tax=Streptomyces sp. NBC_00322 TaxID=2975712 RepID=UPI002E2DC60D|nr:pentapeptide repeat-containing protein [Streptomyces sp. NBC_00322]